MRIALGGVATESCTFSPLLSTLEDFTIFEGEALLDPERYPFLATTRVQVVPTFRARALPGGPVERGTYEAFKERFLDALKKALPLDGLYLDMHGAMNVEGMNDAEGDWYAAARTVVGPDCIISASYDLHGNLSRRIVDTLDMLTAYRTAPHVDTEQTRAKAFGMLEHCLRNDMRPGRVWVSIPMVLPGERTSTEYEPAASLYARLAEVDKVPGILDASLLVGYVWADEPRASASVVLTGTDEEKMRLEANKLAQAYWEARNAFDFRVPTGTVDECISRALAAPGRPVFVSDSGDNPTAGGVGDRADFLRALLEQKVPDAVVAGLADAPATDQCYAAGVGSRVALRVGATLDPAGSQPLNVQGDVVFLTETAEPRERQAVVQVEGVTLVLSHRRRPYHLESDLLTLGVDPKQRKLIVVKLGYLVPDLKRIAGGVLLALSPGVVDQAIERLPFGRVRRPLYPLDRSFDWEPEAL